IQCQFGRVRFGAGRLGRRRPDEVQLSEQRRVRRADSLRQLKFAMSESAALFRRDRVILSAGLIAVALLAWAWLISEAHRMNLSGVCECMRMKMTGPDNSPWPAATLLPLFLMWSVMMVAMMLPGALPMVLTFAAVSRNRQRQARPYVPTTIFVLGYIVIWWAFSAIAAAGQWLLHRSSLLSADMASTSAIFAGIVLFGAGLFQFTP